VITIAIRRIARMRTKIKNEERDNPFLDFFMKKLYSQPIIDVKKLNKYSPLTNNVPKSIY
jgi:hypothetical protein